MLAPEIPGKVFIGEHELALGMIAETLRRYGKDDAARWPMNT
jgi:hypothetical protein